MDFLRQIEALTAIESLKRNYSGYASALKVLAELEPLVETELVPELIRTRQGFPQDRSLESYNRSLMGAIGIARKETADGLSFLASVCTIALCAFLEDAVKDVASREVAQHPEKWVDQDSPQFDAARNSWYDNDPLSVARRRVKRWYQRRNDYAFNNLVSLLKKIGWSNDIKLALSSTLREMYEIRNALVHNGARVDARLKREVSRFASTEIGSKVSLDETQFKLYLSAVDELINTLVLKRLGFDPDE